MTTLIALMKILDAEKLATYRSRAAAALKRHGGSLHAAGAVAETLEGAPMAADTAAVLSFPDAEAARGWINDPELAETHALRRGSGESTIVMLS